MRILQVIPVFNPPELYGGSQQVVYQISKELVKRGHDVTIYSSDIKRGNLKERVSEMTEIVDGVNIVHFRNVIPYLPEKMGLMVTPTMRTTLEQEGKDFDLIHVHEIRGYQHIAVWQFSRKNRMPYIVQAHGILGAGGGLLRRIYDFVYGSKILKDAAMNIALNELESEQYLASGVPRNRIVIIPNGIDLSEYANLPPKGCFKKKLGIGDGERMVLYLGRIHRIKGIDVLVKAFAGIVGKIDDARLVIAGPDDGYLGELEGLIKALNIGRNVLVTSPLYGKEKLEAYVDADIYVLPSRYEVFGVSVLEAYACGKTVIASSCEGLRELVQDHDTGVLVESGNISELSRALTFALSRNTSDLGLRAKKFAKQFSIEKTVDKLETVYDSVMST